MNTDNLNQILSFKLKDQSYAVSIANIKEVINVSGRISKYVGDQNIRGIISYRSGSLPLIDLYEKVLYESSEEKDRMVIIVYEKDSKICGFIVDSVDNIQHITNENVENKPSIGCNSESQLVQKLFKSGSEIIPILEFDQMM